ncbi:MAG: lytic transglycosylase domain-containing protein [Anaerolineales bacterium]|nr:lytic transglycosylase domain-containing protein [Anaerolineales bacterium]
MDDYPFYDYEYQEEAASTPTRGGCFSLLMIPLVTILIITGWLRFLHNGSNAQLAIQISINEIPASAHTAPDPSIPPTSIPSRIASFFAPSVLFWEDEIIHWADQANLDPNLVATVMQIESCGDPRALSPAGAMGLFQVMPYHFDPSEAPYHPDTNASRGLAYLAKSLETHVSVSLALAGYNGGINTAAKPEADWPRETIRYVYWGSGIYQDAQSRQTLSERLEEWYQAGGASLCRQAENRLGISP